VHLRDLPCRRRHASMVTRHARLPTRQGAPSGYAERW
jgi:hypothetical protein